MRSWPIFIATTMLLVGCRSVPGHVLQQAMPSPFSPHSTFYVAPMSFENLTVGAKSEAAYVADKDSPEAWEEDKRNLSASFADELVRRSPDALTDRESAEFLLVPRCSFIEPGFTTGPARLLGSIASLASRPTKVVVTIDIVNRSEELLDQVEFSPSVSGGAFKGYTVADRLIAVSKRLGKEVWLYLRSRVAP